MRLMLVLILLSFPVTSFAQVESPSALELQRTDNEPLVGAIEPFEHIRQRPPAPVVVESQPQKQVIDPQRVEALCANIHEFKGAQAQKKQAHIGATYIPEIDVHGGRVTGANINGQASFRAFDEPLQIPLELDLATYLNLDISDTARGALDLEPILAFITVHKDGRVLYAGQDITSQTQGICP